MTYINALALNHLFTYTWIYPMAKTMENSTAHGTITMVSWLLCPLTCRVVLYLCEAEFIQTLINSGKNILPNHFGTPTGIMLMCCPSTIPNLGIT